MRAIRQGLADGSVSPRVDVKNLYYNAYDSILGVMQKMSWSRNQLSREEARVRMDQLCDVFTAAFRGDFLT